jgi:hypothetical protein
MNIQTTSCNYNLTFKGPETVKAYDAKAGREGACLQDACLKTINSTTIVEWQKAFVNLLSERTGIAPQIDEEATTRAKARSKNPAKVSPVLERFSLYNARVLNEWVGPNGDAKTDQLQKWAQEVADTIEISPSPGVKVGSAELAKANEILSHDQEYIEERVSMMLTELPEFLLTRDAEGKPEAHSLARLLNTYITAKLNL